ncbi:MAG: hypothetical protein KGZ71_03240 [Desulfobulbaceae bacterium]|nr:hypothetical protein [Candidatus Kapabacteria bacterium]MBS3999479.1 hypothetical protein [Desulfobulbaceae bacterium]
MKTIIFFIIIIPTMLLSQDIDKYEYYVGTDPGVGNGTIVMVNADESVAFLDSIPSSEFNPGLNSVCIRFGNDDGIWGLAKCMFILYTPTAQDSIIVLEYFFDDDPGLSEGVKIDLTEESIDLDNIEVSIVGLETGLHKIGMRATNNAKQWSPTVSQTFFVAKTIDPIELVSGEYYIGDDPGLGMANEISIGPSNQIIDEFEIGLDGMSSGLYTLCVRFLNEFDEWSSTQCSPFFIQEYFDGTPGIVDGEWWIGTDPGVGNANAFRFVEPGKMATLFDQAMLTGLAPGVHTIYSRVKDSSGTWSMIYNVDFTINAQGVPVLVYPADMAEDVEIIPTSDWNAVASATSYNIEISTDFVEFEDNIIFSESVDFLTDLIIPEGILDTNKTYYWRVNATVGGNATDWSAYYTFTTKEDLVKFVIQLSQGWNMVSSNVESDVSSLLAITSAITDKMVIMKDNVGNIYFPEFEIDLIENWDITQGYQIFMNEAANLNIWGNQVNPTQEVISLNAGWNMVSYLRNSNMAPATALISLVQAGVLVIVKDNLGNIYFPDFEIDTIELMRPGQGYQMFLMNAFDLTYPAN